MLLLIMLTSWSNYMCMKLCKHELQWGIHLNQQWIGDILYEIIPKVKYVISFLEIPKLVESNLLIMRKTYVNIPIDS